MNEVEMMYKTIFGEFAPNCSLCTKLIDCKIFNNTHNCNKFECDYKRLFTAKKQLELIKLFAKREVYINSQENKYYIFTMNIGGSAFGENLENALARYINNLWQDLTDTEKVQIKEILK